VFWRASSAKLNSSMSLNPKPPHCFGLVMSSEATQHVLRLPSLLPHQKLRRRPFMWFRPLEMQELIYDKLPWGWIMRWMLNSDACSRAKTHRDHGPISLTAYLQRPSSTFMTLLAAARSMLALAADGSDESRERRRWDRLPGLRTPTKLVPGAAVQSRRMEVQQAAVSPWPKSTKAPTWVPASIDFACFPSL
jgi:hypothetical protein